MNDENAEKPLSVWPLIVFQSRSAEPRKGDINSNSSVQLQLSAARQFAIEIGAPIEKAIVISRTRAQYRPQLDRRFLDAIQTASTNYETLVLDDVFRLIDFRQKEQTLHDAAVFHRMGALIFSTKHGLRFSKMPAELLRAEVADRLRRSDVHSSRVKAGIERFRLPSDGPTRKAVEKGALARRRIADKTALQLSTEIERARATLPPEKRSNNAALAQALNEARVPTPSGRGRWQSTTVKRVLDRVANTHES